MFLFYTTWRQQAADFLSADVAKHLGAASFVDIHGMEVNVPEFGITLKQPWSQLSWRALLSTLATRVKLAVETTGVLNVEASINSRICNWTQSRVASLTQAVIAIGVGNLVSFCKHLPLIRQLMQREVQGRYRGAALGIAWSLLTPLLTLAIYAFVFGSVFQAKWVPPAGASPGDGLNTPLTSPASIGDFAIILFVGLIIYGIFAEVITRSPTLVLANTHYVKKIVFPLEILIPVCMGTALFHATLSFAVLFVFLLIQKGGIPLTALWLPIILAPFVVLIVGLGWLLASLGVYLRDISQLMPSFMNILMFLSPVFFPSSAIPAWIRGWLYLNPVALPIEQARNVLIWHHSPDFLPLFLYSVIASIVAAIGYQWFQMTRKGFADVV